MNLRTNLLYLSFVAFTVSLPSLGLGQMIVGHRGASADAPENTLAAFKEAWKQKADGVEGDFYFTKDLQIVCIHDKTTLRTGGKELDVAASSLSQLRQLEYGNWKDPKFAGEPLPTLEDVLAIVPQGKLLVIELKTGPKIVPLVKEQLRKSQADANDILLISFDESTVARCKELMPEIRAHWLTGYDQNVLTGSWTPTPAQIAATLESCGADGLGTKAERQVVTAEFIQFLRKRGMKEFHVWTVDDPKDAQYFQQLGAVGITTNRPGRIRQSLTNPE